MCSSSEVDTATMSVEEYVNFLSFPSELEHVDSAIHNLSEENLLKQGTIFKVYKGQVLLSGDLINIVSRKTTQRKILLNELIISKILKQKNIVSVFKFTRTCDEGFIITKYEPNESLDKHLSSPTTLPWIRRLKICVGIAHALSYLHNDIEVNHIVIHGNIKSSKILLDHNWEPKLNGFGFAIRARKHQLHRIPEYNGSSHYMDPSYEHTGGLTHKSDVYSFGVVLFEVMFGREASINNDNLHFAGLARLHYKERKLDDLIDPEIRKQMELQSFKIFSETAYGCLKEQPSERPDMIQIAKRLESALELQQNHENPVEATSSSYRYKGESLDHLKFRWSDIELATDKFSETYCIGSGGYGTVYRANLDRFDGISLLMVERQNEDELPKKSNTVAIKRLHSRLDSQGIKGFFAEIETLSKCKHPNIVSLLGFCDEGPEMILIYEYASNGSLEDYLGNTNKMNCFTWAQRIQICLDIAHGLNYLHISTEDKPIIVHRDIKSANILLDDNWVAKIADFGLSKLDNECHQGSTLVTYNIAGTPLYVDPEYHSTGKLKTKSDIYSFGVVLFEIMCGKLAYDQTYNENGLPSIARQSFNDGTLKNMVDPKLKETHEKICMLNGGVNQDSLNIFSKVAYQCLAETHSKRPTMEVIIKELNKALDFQRNHKDNRVSLEAIKLGTQNFDDSNCIEVGRFWKLYEGEIAHDNGRTAIFAKRWDSNSHQEHFRFFRELEILFKLKNENIIGLVGYCEEANEKIIVYEHASRGRLNKHLDNPNLTWMKRLKIGIDVANGLECLHKGNVEQEGPRKHRDLKSGSILLDGDWNAKISNLELSETLALERIEHLYNNNFDSLGYVDSRFHVVGFLAESSDIYSLGVILFEMLCGRKAWANGCEDYTQSLGPLAVKHYNEKGNLDEMIFEDIKKQIVPKSLASFQTIAIQCLQDDWDDRPSAHEVVIQLKKALEFQEDCEIWKPKLPKDYKEIIRASKTPEIYDYKSKKELFDKLTKGILLQDYKVWFSLGSDGEKHETISAKRFSYKNHLLCKWRSIPESRFPKVAEMFDISHLKIQIKIRTRYLSPSVHYKVLLIFKFGGLRRSQASRMYVNLKYKMGHESMHAYFATWREDGWMMIELFRFLNHKEDTDFEVQLDSFSKCYCGSHSIYIEGIQFQAVDNVKNQEIQKLEEGQQILKSKSKTDKFLPCEMLSAKKVVYNSSYVAIQSRFHGAIEFQRQQVFRIICKIERQMLSTNSENVCYLVFKLSEKFCGSHCPVIVRDLSHWKSKERGLLYFRTPNPWNLHDTDWVPEKRKDGWMEVIVWKFNKNIELKNDQLFVNLKLTTYEGTMSGLIVLGIEFRPF